jgi:hypothetical protein
VNVQRGPVLFEDGAPNVGRDVAFRAVGTNRQGEGPVTKLR